jgi:hypothetical protein
VIWLAVVLASFAVTASTAALYAATRSGATDRLMCLGRDVRPDGSFRLHEADSGCVENQVCIDQRVRLTTDRLRATDCLGEIAGRRHQGIANVEWGNRTYDTSCGPITVRDGDGREPGEPGDFVDAFIVEFVDVTGDHEHDAVINVRCTSGGNAVDQNVFVFEMRSGSPQQVGQTLHESLEVGTGGLTTNDYVYAQSDARCCPSSVDVHTWTLQNGTWIVANTVHRSLPMD